MRIERRSNPRGVDVVPLIDTVFLLLVIFLMMILRMRVDEGLNVELPPVGSGSGNQEKVADVRTVVIGVTRAGQIVVDGRIVAADAIGGLVEPRGGVPPRVDIRGDRRAPHGVVMAVLTAVQSAGIRDIRFQVSPVYAAAAVKEGSWR